MRSAFLTIEFLTLLLSRISYPFVSGLAYAWGDIVKQQVLANSTINSLPLALIATGADQRPTRHANAARMGDLLKRLQAHA